MSNYELATALLTTPFGLVTAALIVFGSLSALWPLMTNRQDRPS